VASAATAHGILDRFSPVFQVASPSFYDGPDYTGPARRAVRSIPAAVSVAANDNLVAHLTERKVIAELVPGIGPTEYTVSTIRKPQGSLSSNATFQSLMDVVEERMARSTPVFYEAGMLVLRAGRHPRGFPGMGQDASDSSGLAVFLWRQAFNAALQGFGVCPLRKGEPAVRACFARIGRRETLAARARRLDRELARNTGLPGPCGELAREGLSALRRFASELEAVRAAGAAFDPTYLQRGAQLQADFTTMDLPDRPARFWLLCHA